MIPVASLSLLIVIDLIMLTSIANMLAPDTRSPRGVPLAPDSDADHSVSLLENKYEY